MHNVNPKSQAGDEPLEVVTDEGMTDVSDRATALTHGASTEASLAWLTTMADVLFGAVSDGDVLSKLPIVGTARALVRGGLSVRDELLRRKLLLFLSGLEAHGPDLQSQLDKWEATPSERSKLYRMVVQVLDRLVDEERSKLVASLFAGVVEGLLTTSDFAELVGGIDRFGRVAVSELEGFNSTSPILAGPARFVPLLTELGLLRYDYTPHSDGHGLRCIRTPLGDQVAEAIRRGA